MRRCRWFWFDHSGCLDKKKCASTLAGLKYKDGRYYCQSQKIDVRQCSSLAPKDEYYCKEHKERIDAINESARRARRK